VKVKVRGGFDIGLAGAPRQIIREGRELTSVAVLGADFPQVHPVLQVETGDRVMQGQTLFVDRKRPDIRFVSPGTGEVTSITFGHRRVLEALTIHLDGDDAVLFEVPAVPGRENVKNLLLESGMWSAFIARPFGRIPDVNTVPDAIFVTAMDTNPLAVDAGFVIKNHDKHFQSGLELVRLLTQGPVFVCQAPGPTLVQEPDQQLRSVTFSGHHPAGLPGTHIHRLLPAHKKRSVWHIGYQDVIAIGALCATGKYLNERVISLAGPGVKNPSLMHAHLGAKLDDLLANELITDDVEIISGSVLSGRKSAFLGRYHTQVSVLPDSRRAPRTNWLKRFLGTANHALPDALIATEALERAMVLDILPVPLLRALSVGDMEAAERLGCMELVEEDVALLSYACTSNANYGVLLRNVLNELEGRGQ